MKTTLTARATTSFFLHRRQWLVATATVAIGSLAGCGGGPAPATFDLSAATTGLRRSGSSRVIIINEPSAIFALDSERIVVRSASGEVTYLPRAQWTDRLPRLLQTRIVQTLENAGRAAVSRPGDKLTGAFNLVLDIRTFEVREANREAIVEVAAKLAGAESGNVIASRLFSATVPVSGIDGAGVSTSLDRALGRVLADLAAWTAAVA
jgi:cholesterol transport system auxiliary component